MADIKPRVLFPSKYCARFADDPITDGGMETLAYDYIDLAPQVVLEKVLQRHEVNQAEVGIRSNVDEHIDVAIRAGRAPGSRAEERQCREPALPERLLEGLELDLDLRALGRLAMRWAWPAGLPADHQSLRLANDLTGIAVEAGIHLASSSAVRDTVMGRLQSGL